MTLCVSKKQINQFNITFIIHFIQYNKIKFYYDRILPQKMSCTPIHGIYNTCIFLKKLYKYTYICIRDGTGLGLPVPCPVQKRNFVPSRKFLGRKFPVPKCLGTGRDGRDGMGRENLTLTLTYKIDLTWFNVNVQN